MDGETNPYRPPEANLETRPADDQVQAQALYVVSLRKFYALYFGTLGYYGTYWWFRNWAQQRDVEGVKCLPVLRALFPIFFAHAFLRRVARGLHRPSEVLGAEPSLLATIFVAVSIVQGVCQYLPMSRAIMLSLVAGLFVFDALVLGRVQRGINVSRGDPDGRGNDRFTGANIVWIVLGLALMSLAIIGLTAQPGA